MMSVARTLLALAAAAAPAAIAAGQQTVSLQPVADATLYEDATGTLANGAGQGLFAGMNQRAERRRAVLRFDLAAIPAGSHILAAELVLTVSRSTWPTPFDIALHRVAAPWTEGPSVAPNGGGGGGTTQTGDVTWTHSSAPGTFWAAAGGDFAATPSGFASTQQFGPATWASTPAMVQDVQTWLDQPTANQGWLLLAPEANTGEVRRFYSRERATVSQRPQLRVTFAAPLDYAQLAAGCAGPLGTPTNTASTPPQLGQTLTIAIGNLPAPATAWLYLGLSDTVSSQGPLPFDLAIFQAPGCIWRTSGDVVVTASGPGPALTFALGIPNAASLLHVPFFSQAFVFAPGVNAFGGIVSDTAVGVVGP